MGMPARKQGGSASAKRKRLARGIAILTESSQAIKQLADALDEDFLVAVDKILGMRGSLIVCGIGKAGLIGKKLAATFASTGTRAHFLHPSEAIHGDLGRVGPLDVVLMLSNSGATEEIVRLLPFMSRKSAGIIAITGGANSPLARAADIALVLPVCREVCQHNLAPTTSTLAMLALGDALSMVVSEARGFTMSDFAELHPGGSLGRRLATVNEVMRPIEECRVALSSTTIRQMLVSVSRPGRRSGAVMLTDSEGHLEGIFTDSDLARLLEQRRDSDLDQVIGETMTRSFTAIHAGARLTDAIDIMVQRKISELPVVDSDDHPLGMVDITDVLGLEHAAANNAQQSASESLTSYDDESEHDTADGGNNDWGDGPTTLRLFGPLN